VNDVVYATPIGVVRNGFCAQGRDLQNLLAQRSFDLIVSDTTYGGVGRTIAASTAGRKVTDLWVGAHKDERVGDGFLRVLLEEGLIDTEFADNRPELALSDDARQWADRWLKEHNLGGRRVAVLNIDSQMAIKRWLPINYLLVGQWLIANYDMDLLIPVGEDKAMALALAQEIGPRATVLPRQELPRFAALLARADLCVSSDTGPGRIAAAVGVPAVTLYGPSYSGRYGLKVPNTTSPLRRPDSRVINIQSPRECAERNPLNFTTQRCWHGGVCVFGDVASCVDDIAPQMVIAAARRLLEKDAD
jgi:ADP-heptose:LPS heptosyltransferase